ncbi:MAG: acetylglutamate kinase [Vicinamibacteria bacterium]|nr:acetylglutamate kinase [Vicinamibacteria bacterium]
MARARRVYKVGGPALEDPGLLAPLAREIAAFDGEVALVHGGGRQVERMLEKLGIESRFVDGRRQTSPAAMEVVEMILSGSTNKALASSLTQAGVPAVGISGRDGGLIRASLVPGLDRVGTPEVVDPAILEALWAAKLLPVISPVSSGPSGETVNVNADEAAQWIARRIGAETLVFLSDVDGVNLDGGPVSELNEAAIEARTKDGSIHGGMAMKVRMALDAARSGIPSVIIAGRARLSDGFPGTSISIK